MKKSSLGALIAMSAAILASPASASLVTYIGTDAGATAMDPRPNSNGAAAAFAAAIGGGILETFETRALGSFASLALAGGATLTGSNINSANQEIKDVVTCSDAFCGFNTTLGGSRFLDLYGGTATFSFATPIDSFGAYFGGTQIASISLTFNDGVSREIFLPTQFGINFVGFTDFGSSISSITVNALNDIISVDDVRFSGALGGGVPEPATWALMISGFGMVGGAMRRRRAVAA